MRTKLEFILVLFCIFYSPILLYSQIERRVADNIAKDFHELTEKHTSSLIYLQTNKDIYETKEDVWFKGYVLDSKQLSPSLTDKILFTQLIHDKTDKIVWQEKYEINSGFVDGHLVLNDSLQAGTYSLIAYSPESYYKGIKNVNSLRKIHVFKNIKDKLHQKVTKKDSTIVFNMFPEGGDIISGVKSKVAFKAENPNGFPLKVSGKLYENNIPILDFKSLHAGMGTFSFTPNIQHKYHIKLSSPYDSKEYILPKIQSAGITMQLINNRKGIASFRIVKTGNQNKKPVYLRIQSRGTVYTVAMAYLKDQLLLKIPLNDIPQGIAEVTLIDENFRPMAERLIYVNQHKKLYIKTTIGKNDYHKKEKAVLKIKVTDENKQPIKAHLGLSIFDNVYKDKLASKNILTHYNLTSQLRGKIYNPAYYFNHKNTNKNIALDLLLLTHGWRRYTWNKENLKERNRNFTPLLSDKIKGKVRLKEFDPKQINLYPKAIMVFSADSLRDRELILTNSKGTFHINSQHFKIGESAYFYLRPLTAPEPGHTIEIIDNSFNIINSNKKRITLNYPLPKFLDKPVIKEDKTFLTTNGYNKLDEVIVTSKRKNLNRDKYIGTLRELDRLDIQDYVCKYGYLNCINHFDVKRKPIEGKAYVDDSRKNTIIYKIVRKSEKELLEKFNLKMMKGYYGKREFYQPIYDEQIDNSSFSDYRNTLFWKPDIITNEKGEATIEFYCSDIPSTFVGIVEGVNNNGLLGYQNLNFKVK